MKQIVIDIDDFVYDRLEQFGQDRGLDVVEGVKWLLGDFVHHNVPQRISAASAAPSLNLPTSLQYVSPMDKLVQTAALYLPSLMAARNATATCPNCKQDLTAQEVMDNECSKCNQKLV